MIDIIDTIFSFFLSIGILKLLKDVFFLFSNVNLFPFNLFIIDNTTITIVITYIGKEFEFTVFKDIFVVISKKLKHIIVNAVYIIQILLRIKAFIV